MFGTFKARAAEWALGTSSNGSEQIAVRFVISPTEGEFAGRSITWFGFFTDKTTDRTLDSMRYCGWDGVNFADISGLDANEVEIVVEEETYQGKVRSKVQWINGPQKITMANRMDARSINEFAAKMQGYALMHKKTFAGGSPAQNPAQGQTRAPQGGQHGRPPQTQNVRPQTQQKDRGHTQHGPNGYHTDDDAPPFGDDQIPY